MKIALDAQTLCEENKTGIGWTIEKIIDNIDLKDDEYQLNYFAFKNKRHKRIIMEPFRKKGFQIKVCEYFPLGVYRRIWNMIPIPYSLFMGSGADITQFFNYVIPPGVKGKKGVFIYDMVYKACPETMEEKTRSYMEKNVESSCRRADFIITISEFSKCEIIKYLQISPEKIFVVPCGVELEKYDLPLDSEILNKVRSRFSIQKNYYLYLGTLEPRKNITAIIEAYRELRENVKDDLPDLVIAGKKGWGYQELYDKVQEYNLENNVIFTGYITEDEKIVLLKEAICFLFPSLYEGFGIPPLEAMACGTPVIVSNKASLPEVVGKAGILIDPQNSHIMARYMEQLCENKEYRELLGKKGRRHAEKYTWNNAATKLTNVYARL